MRCACGHENPGSQQRCSRCGKLLIAGTDLRRLLIDAAVAAALVAALGLVFRLDQRTASSGRNSSSDTSAPVEVAAGEPVPARPLRLAVTPPEYDDMGKLLGTLGMGYRHTTVTVSQLFSADPMGRYDVVFLTCARLPKQWLGGRGGARQREGGGLIEGRSEMLDRINSGLREYVGRGGTLYASDWQFQLVALAFPELVDLSAVGSGAVQTLRAEVLDRGLQRRLGSTVQLRFDQPAWRTAAFRGPEVTTYLRGTYTATDGREATAPLLAAFPFEQGNVIFTSFHNEAQQSDVELELLRYLVFTTVTARLDAKIKQTMLRGGFSPVERNLLSASSGDQSVTQTYDCPGAGNLQFVLGFEDRGARLRLTVVAPDGHRLEKTGTSTFTIDVANASPGRWQYTVTPLVVPYGNFPFTLTVGQKR